MESSQVSTPRTCGVTEKEKEKEKKKEKEHGVMGKEAGALQETAKVKTEKVKEKTVHGAEAQANPNPGNHSHEILQLHEVHHHLVLKMLHFANTTSREHARGKENAPNGTRENARISSERQDVMMEHAISCTANHLPSTHLQEKVMARKERRVRKARARTSDKLPKRRPKGLPVLRAQKKNRMVNTIRADKN